MGHIDILFNYMNEVMFQREVNAEMTAERLE